jgi:hypothetical protein
VIDGTHLPVVKLGWLPSDWSDQTCELFALNQALKLLETREGTIYTYPQYVLGVVYVWKIWTK